MELITNVIDGLTLEPTSLLIDGGKVISRNAVDAPADATLIDGGGKTLLPSYVDSHCHILPMGLDLVRLDLGMCDSPESMLELLKQALNSTKGVWLLAVQYDQNRFADGQHLHRDQLDKITVNRPILIRHCNGHCSVGNSAALRAAGVSDETPNPAGGTFVRDASGRLTGVLLEEAHEQLWQSVPNLTQAQMVEAIDRAGAKMRSLGIATAHDMMTGRFNLIDEIAAYSESGEKPNSVRARLYVQWREVFGPRGIGPDRLRELIAKLDEERVKVCGIKLFADGAIGSGTAAIYGEYAVTGGAGPVISRFAKPTEQSGTSGQLIYAPSRLKEMILTAANAGFSVAVHAIGDYAVDLVIDGFAATEDPSIHRLEHAMLLCDSQIERIKALGCFVTFQPEFLQRFGHAYVRQLGSETTAKLKRIRSVLDAGIKVALNSDSPIVSGDPADGISNAINRPAAFDPAENITLCEARLGYTAMGADIGGDSGLIGRLLPGELAEYQLLD